MKFEDYMNEVHKGGVDQDFVEEVADMAGVDSRLVAVWINVMGIDDPDDMEDQKEDFVGQLEDMSDSTEQFLKNLVGQMGKYRVSDLTKVKR